MHYLAAFFDKKAMIHSAVQKPLVNFLVNSCVRRSGYCCSGIPGGTDGT
jgi:hypothetical protein